MIQSFRCYYLFQIDCNNFTVLLIATANNRSMLINLNFSTKWTMITTKLNIPPPFSTTVTKKKLNEFCRFIRICSGNLKLHQTSCETAFSGTSRQRHRRIGRYYCGRVPTRNVGQTIQIWNGCGQIHLHQTSRCDKNHVFQSIWVHNKFDIF